MTHERSPHAAPRLIQGNEACALGALRAGCTFYAGYPITPASEIMETLARRLPAVGGVFIQMEDEIGALAAVIGAAWTGAKAMTATSGPGFSLMQENLGYAAMTQTPCVIVDSQRAGPSTGLPTLTSQGDVMQARWGTHGDRAALVLTASSVRDVYQMTVTAFNLSERHRLPAVLLLDATLSHMRENVVLPEVQVENRRAPASVEGFEPFAGAEFLPFGAGARIVVTGLAHQASGRPAASDGAGAERMLLHALADVETDPGVFLHRVDETDDAELVILAYGITARAARAAMRLLREEGVHAGLLELQTLWPFPESLVARLAEHTGALLVPELNLGQLVLPVRAAAAGRARVVPLNRADGVLFSPEEIARAARRVLTGREAVHA
ncbi:MAG TPA: 2-oxoacid:acceptor oxidoreductase subunit alpha [Gemmatimonadales bacterium]|nr:2-oxoacid:acceptor oxidoreductase subunit alpha [Gemmatimonadales bacterium]